MFKDLSVYENVGKIYLDPSIELEAFFGDHRLIILDSGIQIFQKTASNKSLSGGLIWVAADY